MDQLKIIQFFQENYNLFAEKLIKVKSGMVGDNFFAETKHGKKYFVKIYGNSRIAEISKQNIDFYTKCLKSLEKDKLKVPRIIENNKKQLVSDFFGNPLIVFNFIEKDKSDISNFEKEVKSKLYPLSRQ